MESLARLQTHHLTKAFGRRVVVHDVDLILQPGEIYGFLGPNGAGKTTLIRLVLGLLRPTRGSIAIDGQAVVYGQRNLHERIGVVGEHSRLYDDMTAREYLRLFAGLYGLPAAEQRIAGLLELVGLGAFADLLAITFSQGMQKRLNLARSLLHQPSLLILDEITSGLDPQGIIQVRDILYQLRQQGCSILISSHILSEIEKVADRVGVIQAGQLIFQGTIDEIARRASVHYTLDIELEQRLPGMAQLVRQVDGVISAQAEGSRLRVVIVGQEVRGQVSNHLVAAGGTITAMQLTRPSLEDAFLALTASQDQNSVPGVPQ